MSAPRGNREFYARGRGQPDSARGTAPETARGGKPMLLKRPPGSDSGAGGSNMLMNEGPNGGPSRPDESRPSRAYGAPPQSMFNVGSPSNAHFPPPSAFGPAMYQQQAPSVKGPTSAFGPSYQQQAPSVRGPTSAFGSVAQKQPLQEETEQEPSSSLASPSFLNDLLQEHIQPQPLLSHPHHQLAYNVLHSPPPPPMFPPPFCPPYGDPRLMMDPSYAQFVNHRVALPMYQQALAMRIMNGPLLLTPQDMQSTQRMQREYDQTRNRLMNEPKFFVEELHKFSKLLKKVVCQIGPVKKLAALVEMNRKEEILRVKAELLEDMQKWDGRSNVPVSRASLPYLKKKMIEFLPVLHAQFPWAPYYCNLCDFHISDIFAADAHLVNHVKEEQRMEERKSLPTKLPPPHIHQLAAIEKVLVDEAVKECLPGREESIRASAAAAMDSLRELCLNTQFDKRPQGILISLYGSLVSGLLTDQSDINISLTVDGENTKFFVDLLVTAMEKAAEWSEVKLCESPIGQARIQANFNNEKVTIDWQNEEGVRMSKLLSLYNRLNEDLLPLRQIVYKWAEKCDLITEEKLSSQHAVPRVLMDVILIHALQQMKRLPCIHDIRKGTEKGVVDDDLEDIQKVYTPSIRWNLAEVFLEFLHYFSKGDAKQFLIQMTQVEKISKNDTKYNKKQLNVIDPIRDKPIASLHKTFLCYFINCFLTSYINFRVPKKRCESGVEALIDVEVYQTASQSPQKKKTGRDGKKEDQKDDKDDKGNDNEAPPPTPSKNSKAEALAPRDRLQSEKECEDTESTPEYTLPIVIHGKPLEKMRAEDFEIDGDAMYSRREMMKMKESDDGRIENNLSLFDVLAETDILICYPAPDSENESSQESAPAPVHPAPLATPVVAVYAVTVPKKKKNKKKAGKKGDKQGNEEKKEVVDEITSPLSIGQCTSSVLDSAGTVEEASTSFSAPPATPTKIEAKKKVPKLIKLDSADSSEVSCNPSPSPTEEKKDIVNMVSNLAITQPPSSSLPTIEPVTEKTTSAEKNTVAAEDTVVATDDTVSILTEHTAISDDECEEEKKEAGDDDEIVLPESGSPELQPTFEELYVKLKDFDWDKLKAEVDALTEDEYAYSFDTVSLTAGFKCDQHCTGCDSPKHLVSACPQLKIPPVRVISRTHWKPYYAEELDRIICMAFDNDRISDHRRKELTEIKTNLHNAIQRKLKSQAFRLDAFGSSENGFGSNRSDFDVCFRYAENAFQNGEEKTPEKQMNTIYDIDHALRHARFYKVMSITTAKVPIVKFACRIGSGGEIEGDISYYNELALHNTHMLKRYCSWTKDEVLSKLGMFIKRWAKQCDIGDASKGSLSSYAYIILVIHFLQRVQPHPLLPVLQEMGDKQVIKVDNWDVYFCDDEPKPDWSKCTLSVGELFLQFLEYYSKFDWHNQVVQIRQLNKLSKIERGWRKLMCIEDPFDLDHNLGSGISNRMFAFILKSFVTSREVFFGLKERPAFLKQFGNTDGEDCEIAESFICRYGNALLNKCRASIGGAPRDRQCFKCGRIGHFSDNCPTPSSGFGRRGGGGGGRGGGGVGRDDRGGGGAGGGAAGGSGRDDRGNGGGGGRGSDDRGGGGYRRDDYRNRDVRKERLASQREAYTNREK